MGLDTSHDCWSGPYSLFCRWREELAKAAGLPPLPMMRGFFESVAAIHLREIPGLPLEWECLKPRPLLILLNHSDCDGEIEWEHCAAIADDLESLLPNLHGNHAEDAQQFVEGLRLAAEAQENVEFH